MVWNFNMLIKVNMYVQEYASKHLLVKTQLFKFNNKDSRAKSLTLFWCLYF